MNLEVLLSLAAVLLAAASFFKLDKWLERRRKINNLLVDISRLAEQAVLDIDNNKDRDELCRKILWEVMPEFMEFDLDALSKRERNNLKVFMREVHHKYPPNNEGISKKEAIQWLKLFMKLDWLEWDPLCLRLVKYESD